MGLRLSFRLKVVTAADVSLATYTKVRQLCLPELPRQYSMISKTDDCRFFAHSSLNSPANHEPPEA